MQSQEIVTAIQTAVSEVFSTMLGIEVEPCDSRQDPVGPRTTEGIVSFVGLAGTWVGSGLISCHSSLACRLCSLFLMTDSTEVDEEVQDAIGEIANMVIGNFKTVAEAKVGPLTLSIPTTIYGQNFSSKSLGNNEWTVVPFKIEDKTLEVWVWFAPAARTQTSRQGSIQLQAV
jgi:chemotaxis protein CheX